ncbi:MAG: tRNA (adenosine(37)-N6)-threonylcarbamoyltransferase complex ATPase subunit type 1 TsaE [bacterium]
MSARTLPSRSAAETIALGRALADELAPGDIVAFFGDLGSGKTTMIKGIAAGLGVAEKVRSPSFVIVTEYRGRLPVYHVDLYRLADAAELGAAELDEYFDRDGITIVEWAERALGVLPERAVRVSIEFAGEGRAISIERGASGPAEMVE